MDYRTKLVGRLAVMTLVGLVSAQAVASHPDILRNYRIIPRHSTLEVTGGFAGVNLTYDLFGRFGLVTGYEDGYSCLAIGCPPPPTHIPFAKFVDIDVKALLNDLRALAAQLPLEQFVDLEDLNGTFHDPNRLTFRGEDNQGAPFKLQARLHGRLIHLTGTNDPPCCDFFNYKLDAFAHLAPFADFNFDGTVDAADYTMWRDHVGMTSGASLDQGDADGDGDVDQDDYAIWRHDLGMSIDMAALADTDGVSLGAVPEPATITLLLLGVLALAPRTRRLVHRAG